MNESTLKKLPDPALLDFGIDHSGTGYRLEKMGDIVLVRPLPSTTARQQNPELWKKAHGIFKESRRGHGDWTFSAPLPDPWQITLPLSSGLLQLHVRPSPSGQVGIFLEQLSQWQWLSEKTPQGSRMLSLFAHSGAATLALAQAGAEVVHVDSSRQALQLARKNATASGLDDASIRWICEDAQRFVTRERTRGNTYDGFVLDPPSWGHGPKGEAFSIDKHLLSLLTDCAQLLSPTAHGPILLTAHSPGWHHQRLATALMSALQVVQSRVLPVFSGSLSCMDLHGRTLHLGGFARSSGIVDTAQ